MFNDIPTKFPRLFALMWFSQSKSAEADWAINTSTAALTAWKNGIDNVGNVISKHTFHKGNLNISPANKTVFSSDMTNHADYIFNINGRIQHSNCIQPVASQIFIQHNINR
jgi:hypothetical protein